MEYNLAAIKDLIEKALIKSDFDDLVFYHFRSVHEQFTNGQTQNERIRQLLEYVQKYQDFRKLLELIESKNPIVYREFSSTIIQNIPNNIAHPVSPNNNEIKVSEESLAYSNVLPTDLTFAEQVAIIKCINGFVGGHEHEFTAATIGELILKKRLAIKNHEARKLDVEILDFTPIGDLILDSAIVKMTKWRKNRQVEMGYNRWRSLLGETNHDKIDNLVDRQLINKGFYTEGKIKDFGIFPRCLIRRTEKLYKKRNELSKILYEFVISERSLDERTAFILSFCSLESIFSLSQSNVTAVEIAVEITQRKLQENVEITALTTILKEIIKHCEHVDHVDKTNPGRYTM